MKFIVNLTDVRGRSKIKIVEAFDVKEAESKAKSKYPSWEVEIRSHNKMIDEKEKILKIKHQKMWKKKKDTLSGFNG